MKRILTELLDGIVYTHLFIATGTACQILLTYEILGLHWQHSPLIALGFIASIAMYTAQDLYQFYFENSRQNTDNERFKYIKKYRFILIVFLFISSLYGLYAIFLHKKETVVLMGVAGVLSIAYFIPIFGKKLREYVLFKSILIAFIWSVLVVVLPITHEGISVNNATITIFLTRFFFILGLTIPFDIRDMDWDHRNGVSTTPLSYGIKKTKILAIASILVACFIDLLLFFKNMFSAKALVANVLIYTITVFSIFLIKNKKHDYYYRLWLDGLLIMQSAVLLLCT